MRFATIRPGKGGNYTTQPPSLRTAAALIYFMGSNPILRQEQMPTLAKADEVLDAVARDGDAHAGRERHALSDRARRGTTTRLRGSRRIRAPLIAVNSADDLINPPELGHPRARDQARETRQGRRDPPEQGHSWPRHAHDCPSLETTSRRPSANLAATVAIAPTHSRLPTATPTRCPPPHQPAATPPRRHA